MAEKTDIKNEILHTIYTRRAVRKFKKDPVDRSVIEQIIDAGRMAPSAMNKQPWHFHVLTDPKLIKIFSASIMNAGKFGMLKAGLKEAVNAILHPGTYHLKDGLDFFSAEDPIFHGAPVVIFISSPKSSEWAPLDVGMCAQNMMLAAKALGLDSCPIGLARFIEQSELYAKLNIPSSNHVNLAIILGFADEAPVLHERNRENLTYIE